MPQYNQITKKVNMAASSGTARVWDNPCGVPIKNLTIIVRLGGSNIANITQEVFLGGHFESSGKVVAPYTEGSTLTGGVSQAAAAAIGTGTTAAHVIYSTTGLLPANSPGVSENVFMPVSVNFINTNAAEVNLEVTFISETISSTL